MTEGKKNKKLFPALQPYHLGLPVFLLVLICAYYDFRVSGEGLYNEGQSVYAGLPKGMDFKQAYAYGSALLQGVGEYLKIPNAYPPLVTILLLPLQALPMHLAYQVYVLFLACCMFAAVYLSLGERVSLPEADRVLLAFAAAALLSFTYPVNFAFERGNSDILVAALCAGAVFTMRRGKLVPSIVLLTIAAQFKVYPVFLAVVLLARFGWRAIAVFGAVNFACLFILGPDATYLFYKNAKILNDFPIKWTGNHSFLVFIWNFVHGDIITRATGAGIRWAGSLLMVGMYIYAGIKYKASVHKNREAFSRAERLEPIELGVIGLSFCMMSLLIITSNDYKLLIHIVPYLLLISRPQDSLFASRRQTFVYISLMSAAAGYLFIPKSGLYPLRALFGDLAVFQMKTPALLTLFCGYLYLVFKGKSPGAPAATGASTDDDIKILA